MAKKIMSKEYLEEKIKTLTDQQIKVTKVLNDYSKLYDKLDGAIEVTTNMLRELEAGLKIKDDDSKNESGG